MISFEHQAGVSCFFYDTLKNDTGAVYVPLFLRFTDTGNKVRQLNNFVLVLKHQARTYFIKKHV